MRTEHILPKIKEILVQHDPAGVMSDDDNPDEYDAEANEILDLLRRNLTQEDIQEEVYKVFVRHFNEKIAGEKRRYEPIAQELIRVLRLP